MVLQIVLIMILEKPESILKILTFHNVMVLIKSFVNKNKNKYYYNIFLEKGSYKDKNVYIL